MSAQLCLQSMGTAASDPIASFPTSGQPVSDTTLKDMLLFLRASLQHDFLSGIHQYRIEVQELGERVYQVEDKMSDFASSFNKLVNAYDVHSEDLSCIKFALADMEDRSGCNKLKIRRIPESVSRSQLPHYIRDIFCTAISSLAPVYLTIDRNHCIAKLTHLSTIIPQDVLLRMMGKNICLKHVH